MAIQTGYDMFKHELGLLDNALDSLNEALAKYQAGEAGDEKAYKFAVLHMAHFLELVLKHHITQKHPLLIYRDPFAKNLTKEKTIGLWDAVNFINNESSDTLSPQFKKDLEWLKELRNNIEHYKFSMDVFEARHTIGRVFFSLHEFLEEESNIDLAKAVGAKNIDIFQTLSDEYKLAVHNAIIEVDKIKYQNPQDPMDPNQPAICIDCDECGHPTLALCADSSTGYRCKFCKNEYSDYLPSSCTSCGCESTIGELETWENENGDTERRCYHCSGRHHMDKDD